LAPFIDVTLSSKLQASLIHLMGSTAITGYFLTSTKPLRQEEAFSAYWDCVLGRYIVRVDKIIAVLADQAIKKCK